MCLPHKAFSSYEHLHMSKEESKAVRPVPSSVGARGRGLRCLEDICLDRMFCYCPKLISLPLVLLLCLKVQRLNSYWCFPFIPNSYLDLHVEPLCYSLQMILFTSLLITIRINLWTFESLASHDKHCVKCRNACLSHFMFFSVGFHLEPSGLFHGNN